MSVIFVFLLYEKSNKEICLTAADLYFPVLLWETYKGFGSVGKPRFLCSIIEIFPFFPS